MSDKKIVTNLIFDNTHFAMYLGDTYNHYYDLKSKSFNGEYNLVCKVLLDLIKQYNKEYL